VPDCFDNCPFDPNPDQSDSDSNGVGDACELPLDGACCLQGGACIDLIFASECAALGGCFSETSLCPGDQNGNGVDDLCEVACQIPTVSTWGIVCMALVLVVAGKVYFRRDARRMTASQA
jgi:hypothetical protein